MRPPEFGNKFDPTVRLSALFQPLNWIKTPSIQCTATVNAWEKLLLGRKVQNHSENSNYRRK